MNIDLDSQFQFGDAAGLRSFFLVHRFVHSAYQDVLQTKFGVSFSTFSLTSDAAEREWEQLMQQGEKSGSIPPALGDWLRLHADLHSGEYAAIGGSGNTAPDLSTVDFSDPAQFADWMYAHQQMHDYEAQQLGVT
jgi:hypothetical protein